MASEVLPLNAGAWDWSVASPTCSFDPIKTTFKVASTLTAPICKVREFLYRSYLVDTLNPTSSKAANYARKFFLVLGIVGAAALATFTTLPGIGLRALAVQAQTEPFLTLKTEEKGKTLPMDRSFTLLSWNICGTPAGYSITDGGVLPWEDRIDAVVDRIVKKNADVNCLYETFDTHSALYLVDKLKEQGYRRFYYNIGPQAIGPCSGIMVASKYDLGNPEFTRFPQEALVGRTKNCAKGVFSFDLQSQGKSFGRIVTTHLQHSEECSHPTEEEREARKKEMDMLLDHVNKVRDRCVVVTGDLNLDDDEYNASSWRHLFYKNDLYRNNLKNREYGQEAPQNLRAERVTIAGEQVTSEHTIFGEKPTQPETDSSSCFGIYSDPDRTWGGSGFCGKLMGIRPSGPLNLDHTMLLKGSAHGLSTELVKTNFEGTEFRPQALSDHAGLFSKIDL